VLEEKLDNLNTKFDRLEVAMRELTEKQNSDKASSNKLLIGAAATVIAGLLSTVVLLLLNLQGLQ
jgi:hypothetical protein